jgi:CRISPR-associated protein Cmr6
MDLFYTVFEIRGDLEYHDFKKELEKFGITKKVTLYPDKRDKSKKFGTVDFEKIHDKSGLEKFLSSISNRFKRQPSNSQKAKTNATPKKAIRQGDTEETTITINCSFLYYKDEKYGKNLPDVLFDDSLTDLLRIPGSIDLELTTLYPGLLVGAGYAHPKLKENKDDFQLGFYFDHTTGLPVIPGSSVKGALRSILPGDKDSAELKRAKEEYFMECYSGSRELYEEFKACFEDNATRFFDAYPIKTARENREKIFADDYITSHFSNEPDGMFKEPNPVRFLKIRSGVTFRFQFDADEKLVDLFEAILLDRGIGAKTNVGYGQFAKS